MLTEKDKRFLNEASSKMIENGVAVKLHHDIAVPYGNFYISGYFDPETPEFCVATEVPTWFGTFIHEFCHFEQWLENCPSWQNCYIDDSIAADDLIDLWLNNKIELNNKQLDKYIHLTRQNEEDCEKRAVRKIIDRGLSINSEQYIQKANSYLYFYTVVQRHRKWCKKGRAPYNNEDIVKLMPTKFLPIYSFEEKKIIDYHQMNKELERLFVEWCFSK